MNIHVTESSFLLQSIVEAINRNNRGQNITIDTDMRLNDTKSTDENKFNITPVGSKTANGILLERGHISFVYKPKVELNTVKSIDDVQRLYIILQPTQSIDNNKMNRLITVGKKVLPKVNDNKDKNYAYIEAVSNDIQIITKAFLEPKVYQTPSLGERHLSGARVIAEGIYDIVKTNNNQTRLVYVIEQPTIDKFGEAQQIFNIRPTESIVLVVKNPTIASASGFQGITDKPKYPNELMLQHFTGSTKQLRWAQADIELINYQHCELLLVSAHNNIEQELGELAKELEKEAQQEQQKMLQTNTNVMDPIYSQLKLNPDTQQHPTDPVQKGKLA